MARAIRPSFHADANLFRPEPPITAELVRKLFHGRERVFQRGVEYLKANLDVGGKRSRHGDKCAWVIHGESRNGKSHLARRIHHELCKNAPNRMEFLLPAGSRQTAEAVFKDLFEQMRGDFQRRFLDQKRDVSDYEKPDMKTVRRLIEETSAFRRSTTTIELSEEVGANSSGGIGFEIGGPNLIKFLLKSDAGKTEKNTRKLSIRPPDAHDLAEICGIMVETLMRYERINHALILIDDLDLLETEPSVIESPSSERWILSRALQSFHETAGVDVVLTARSYWYAYTRKDFQLFIDLSAADPLSPEELREIYRKRVGCFAKRSMKFLDENALIRLAEDVDGLPGVFLQHLSTAFYHFQHEEHEETRDYAWLLDVGRRQLERFRRECPTEMEAIERAVRGGASDVSTRDNPNIRKTVLNNEVVVQSYHDESRLKISGHYRRIIRDLGGAP